MTSRQDQARHLYMTTSCTQREIAEQLGVSERTIYNWIKGNAWDRLRQAAYAAPVMIAENLCSQLVELQNDIAGREAGKRYPTMQEAEITRKLITGIEKMKKYPSLPQSTQVLETFKQFIAPSADREFRRILNMQSVRFLEGQAKNGYLPYQLEYGMDNIPPLNPYYQEKEEPEILTENPSQTVDSTTLQPVSGSTTQPEKTGNYPETEGAAQRSFDLTRSFGEGRGEGSPQPEKTGNYPESEETAQPSLDLTRSFGEGQGEAETGNYSPTGNSHQKYYASP